MKVFKTAFIKFAEALKAISGADMNRVTAKQPLKATQMGLSTAAKP